MNVHDDDVFLALVETLQDWLDGHVDVATPRVLAAMAKLEAMMAEERAEALFARVDLPTAAKGRGALRLV